MTGGPRGTPAPLSLVAVEARLNATEVCYECRMDMQALLAHAHAVRAALHEDALLMDHLSRSWGDSSAAVAALGDHYYWALLDAHARAIAVLGAARDGPA